MKCMKEAKGMKEGLWMKKQRGFARRHAFSSFFMYFMYFMISCFPV